MRNHYYLLITLLVVSFFPAIGLCDTGGDACTTTVFTVSGVVPKTARGIYEVDASEVEQIDLRDRPTIQLNLDEYGYPGQSINLRLSRAYGRAWVIEYIDGDSGGKKKASRANQFGPLLFGDNDKQIGMVGVEFNVPRQSGEHSGNRVAVTFSSLSQATDSRHLDVLKVETVTSPCWQPPKTVIGPEELQRPEYQVNEYDSEDGYIAMVNDIGR